MTTSPIYPITRLYPSCDACGLPVNTCICSRIPALKTQAQIWILSTAKELCRPSNTARLLKLMNPESTEIYVWERTREPEALLKKIAGGNFEPYLLFPAENEESRLRQATYRASGKIPAFILIDGTWQEARKIYRKNPYLKNLPLLSLDTGINSAFTLRKGGKEGQLCTLETVVETLSLCGEREAGKAMDSLYRLFLKSYRAGVCGHGLKHEEEAAE